jgi:ATP-dependent RNA helicase SUPV3L1/SUV3
VEPPGRSTGLPPQETPADVPSETPAGPAHGGAGDMRFETPGGTPRGGTAPEPEIEVFYTFTWEPKRRGGDRPQRRAEGGGGKPRGQKPRGGKPRGKGGKGGKDRQDGPAHLHGQDRQTAKVDPDNPFAVLAALKDKS